MWEIEVKYLTEGDYQKQSPAEQKSSASSLASYTPLVTWSVKRQTANEVKHRSNKQKRKDARAYLVTGVKLLDIPEHLLHELLGQQDLRRDNA